MDSPKMAKKSPSTDSLQTPPPPRLLRSRLFIFLMFVLVAVALDQGSKFLAPLFFGSVVAVNHGVSFGLFGTISPLVIAAVLLGFICVFYRSTSPVILGVIGGSALSNLLDRFFVGGVRDWLSIPFLGLHNNLADWMLFLAVLISVVQFRHGTPDNTHSV